MSGSGRVIEARALAPGAAAGPALVLDEPLSLWGGMDVATGRVVDVRHPQAGEHLAGRVVVMPGGRGSSSSSSVLAEAVRLGTAPAAIILAEPDAILAVGSLVAAELYGTTMPLVACAPEDYALLRTQQMLCVEAGKERAEIRITPAG